MKFSFITIGNYFNQFGAENWLQILSKGRGPRYDFFLSKEK